MNGVLTAVAVCLMGTFAVGLVRIVRGPTRADRMIAAQLFGTTGAAVILVVSRIQEVPGLVEVALVLALLTVLTVVAFVRSTWSARRSNRSTAVGEEP